MTSGGSGTWNPRFLRPFNAWEMEAVQNFMSLTFNRKIIPTVIRMVTLQ